MVALLAVAVLAGCHGRTARPAGRPTSRIAELVWLNDSEKLLVRVSEEVQDREVDSAVWELSTRATAARHLKIPGGWAGNLRACGTGFAYELTPRPPEADFLQQTSIGWGDGAIFRTVASLWRGDSLDAYAPSGREFAFWHQHALPDDNRPGWMNRSPADGIYVFDVASKRMRSLVTAGSAATFPMAWSPDGKQLVYERISGTPIRHDLWVADVNSGGTRPLTSCGGVRHWVTWAPDGQSVLFVRENAGWELWRAEVGVQHITRVLSWEELQWPGGWSYITPSPDGTKTLSVGDGMGQALWLIDLKTKRATRLEGRGVSAARWSPDGKQIACVRDRKELWLLTPGKSAKKAWTLPQP